MTRSLNRAVLALAFAFALLCVAALAACGGSESSKDGSAEQTLEQTFGATAKSIDRGRVTANLRLEPEGLLKLGGPIAVRLTGPFAAPDNRDLPRFDLAFLGTLAGQQFRGSAISTGRKAFVKLDGRTYAIDDESVSELRKDLGDSPAKRKSGLKALGIDPLRWIKNPESKGKENIGGVPTERVGGDVNTKNLLADLAKLLDTAGGGGSGGGGGLLTPKLRTQIAEAVKSAKVDVWSNEDNSILRQLAVVARFAFKEGQSPIPGLDGGRLTLRVRLDDVNGAGIRIPTPKRARPLSELTGEGGLGALFGGVSAGITGGIGPGQSGSGLLRCITQAGGSSADVVRCVSKLAP